jgi:hypothetical protein
MERGRFIFDCVFCATLWLGVVERDWVGKRKRQERKFVRACT